MGGPKSVPRMSTREQRRRPGATRSSPFIVLWRKPVPVRFSRACGTSPVARRRTTRSMDRFQGRFRACRGANKTGANGRTHFRRSSGTPTGTRDPISLSGTKARRVRLFTKRGQRSMFHSYRAKVLRKSRKNYR